MRHDAFKAFAAAIAVLCGSVAVVLEGQPALAEPSAADVIKKIDRNGDGLINATEAKQAAATVITQIDADHNGVLTNEELGGRVTVVDKLSPAGKFMHWKTEGTLAKQEYLDLVEGRFEPATPDDDGTLDAKELETEEGQALLKLLQ